MRGKTLRTYLCWLGTTCLIVALLYRLLFWYLHPLLTWADQSVYLAMGQLLLQGKIPYIDFFDFNLPLIIYLNAIPVGLAGLLGQPPPLVLDCCVLILLAVSVILSNSIFRGCSSRLEYYTRLPWLAALLIFTQMQDADFAQREHIFVLLLAPYILLRCLYPTLRNEGDDLSRYRNYLIGIMAGIGGNIKPHFTAVVLIFELAAWIGDYQNWKENFKSGFSRAAIFAMLRKRFARPEMQAFTLTTALYGLHFFLYPSKAWHTFIDIALPVYYHGSAWFGHSLIASISGEEDHKWYFFALIAATLLALPQAHRSRLTMPVLVFTWLAVIIYFYTGGTWTYRLLPVQAGTLWLFALEAAMATVWLRQRVIKHWTKFKIGGAVALAAVTSYSTYSLCHLYLQQVVGAPAYAPVGAGYRYSCPVVDFSALYYSILANSLPGDKVVYMGTGVRPGYPATVQAKRLPGSRYLHGMIIPMVSICMQTQPGDKYKKLMQDICDQYGTDITKNTPALVYVQHGIFEPKMLDYFKSTYLIGYDYEGNLESMGCGIYKLHVKGIIADENSKAATLMRVMLKEINVNDASSILKMPPEEVETHLKSARLALDRSMYNTVGGGDEELFSRLQRCENEKAVLERTIEKLLMEQAKLKAAIRAKSAVPENRKP